MYFAGIPAWIKEGVDNPSKTIVIVYFPVISNLL